VGDRKGVVGLGFGKAHEVPQAVDKGVKEAKKNLARIPLMENTIPHSVWGRFGASQVFMKPAAPGTGVIAGPSVRALVELAGIKNVLTKSFGRNNPVNLCKAAMDALRRLRTKEQVERLRGVVIE
jgi:small subunit ribosomal protein S5